MNYQNLIIAHRGCWDKTHPENSLPAFYQCVEKSVPIELDVQLSLDEEVVVFHDKNTLSMTGVSLEVEKSTFQELRKLKLSSTVSKIPTLKEVLDLVKGKVLLLIEIKRGRNFSLLSRKVYELLKDYSGEVMIQSFDIRVVWWWKRKTDYPTGLLVSSNRKLQSVFYYPIVHSVFVVEKLLNVDFISVDFEGVTSDFISKLRKRKMPVFVWTITKLSEFEGAKLYANCFIADGICEKLKDK